MKYKYFNADEVFKDCERKIPETTVRCKWCGIFIFAPKEKYKGDYGIYNKELNIWACGWEEMMMLMEKKGFKKKRNF